MIQTEALSLPSPKQTKSVKYMITEVPKSKSKSPQYCPFSKRPLGPSFPLQDRQGLKQHLHTVGAQIPAEGATEASDLPTHSEATVLK